MAVKIVHHLNWNLQTYKDREQMVMSLIDEGMLEDLSPYQINEVTNYLLYAEDIDAEAESRVLEREGDLDNHYDAPTEVKLKVPNKPQVSYEELVETGIAESVMQRQSFSIYKVVKPTIDRVKDADIPTMKELWEAIDHIKFYYDYVRDVIKGVRERDFTITIEPTFVTHNFFRSWYIDLCRNQYYLKDIFKPTICCPPTFNFNRSEPDYFGIKAGKYILCEHGDDHMIDLGNPDHIYLLLRQYVSIKEKHYDKIDDWSVLYDILDDIIEKINWSKQHWDILQMKINYVSNEDIAQYIWSKYDIHYSVNYISTIFKRHISRDIARRAIKEAYRWHHRNDEGAWKVCSRCKIKRFNDVDNFGKNKRVCLFCTGKRTGTGKKLEVPNIPND